MDSLCSFIQKNKKIISYAFICLLILNLFSGITGNTRGVYAATEDVQVTASYEDASGTRSLNIVYDAGTITSDVYVYRVVIKDGTEITGKKGCITLTTGSSSCTETFTEEGTYEVRYKVVASVSEEPTEEELSNVIKKDLDNQKPEITVSQDEAGKYKLTIKDNNLDTDKCTLKYNRKTITNPQGEKGEATVSLTDCTVTTEDSNNIYETEFSLKDGIYSECIVVVSDCGGNTAEQSVIPTGEDSIVADCTEPEILIQGVENLAHYKSEKKTIGVEVKELQMKENNPVITIEKEDSSGNITTDTITQWSEDTNPYIFKKSVEVEGDGKYTVTVTAEDKDDRTSEKQVIFVLDTVAPDLPEQTPILCFADNKPVPDPKQEGGKDVYYLNKSGKVQFSVNEWNYETATVTMKKNDQVEFSEFMKKRNQGFQQIYDEEGSYAIHIDAVDKAGNESQKEADFVIDKKKPVFSFGDSIENGKSYSQGQTLSLFAEDKNIDLNNCKVVVSKENRNGNSEVRSYKWLDIVNATSQNKHTYDTTAYSWSGEQNGDITKLTMDFSGAENEGNYKITISGMDKACNEGDVKRIGFHIDKTPPVVDVNGFANGKSYNHAVTFRAFIDEYNIASTMATLRIESKLNTTDTPVVEEMALSIEDGGISKVFTKEGDYMVTLLVKDAAGNEGVDKKGNLLKEKAFTFSIDKTAPELLIQGIKKDTMTKEDVNLTYGVIDRHHDFANYKITVQRTNLDGYEKTETKVFDESKWLETSLNSRQKQVTYSKEGIYKITFTATDKAGNTGKKTIRFYVDKTAPKISRVTYSDVDGVILPKYNNIYSNNVIRVEFNVRDLVVGVDSGKVYVTVGTQKQQGDAASLYIAHKVSGERYVVYIPTDMKVSEFRDTITIWANDKIANESFYVSDKVIYTTDYAQITMNCDTDYTKWTNKNVVFHTTVKDTKAGIHKIVYKVNNKVVKTVQFRKLTEEYSYDVVASESASVVSGYKVEIEVVNNCNTVSEASRRVYIDKVKPKVSLSGITNGAHYNKDQNIYTNVQEVSFNKTKTRYYITRSLEGVKEPVSAAVFHSKDYEDNRTLTMINEGVYEIYAVTTDGAGNSTVSNTLQFVIDKTAPLLNITGTSPDEVSAQPVTLTFSSEEIYYDTNVVVIDVEKTLDGESRQYTINGFRGTSKYSSMAHTFSEDGTYRVTISAVDKAGNVAVKRELIFTVDGTKPEIRVEGTDNYQLWDKSPNITFVVEESYYSGNEVTIKGTRRDIHGTVTELKLPGFTNTGKISRLTQLMEKDGIYDFEIISRDEAGNMERKEIHFTVDKTAPKVNLVADFDGGYYQEFCLTDDIQDVFEDLTVLSYKILLNGVEYNGTSDITEEGKYNLYVQAVDELGHKTERSAEFIIDHTAPKVIFTGAQDGGNVYQKGEIQFALTNSEDEVIDVRLNGEDLGTDVRSFSYTEYGSYHIEVDCRDKAGNAVTRSLYFVYTDPVTVVLIAGGMVVMILSTCIWLWVRTREHEREEHRL